MGDLDDRERIFGLTQKIQEEVSLMTVKRESKMEYNLTEKFTEIFAEFTRAKTVQSGNQKVIHLKQMWKMRCKSSRTLIRDKRREPNCIKIGRDKRAE